MTVVETETRQTEEERVLDWRLEQLVRAGYGRSAAQVLATCTDVDLHLAADLLRRGCPARTALQILR